MGGLVLFFYNYYSKERMEYFNELQIKFNFRLTHFLVPLQSFLAQTL